MLGVMQTIAVSYETQEFNFTDLEYLAYQLLQKHSKKAVDSMDSQTVRNEINKIIKTRAPRKVNYCSR